MRNFVFANITKMVVSPVLDHIDSKIRVDIVRILRWYSRSSVAVSMQTTVPVKWHVPTKRPGDYKAGITEQTENYKQLFLWWFRVVEANHVWFGDGNTVNFIVGNVNLPFICSVYCCVSYLTSHPCCVRRNCDISVVSPRCIILCTRVS